MYFLYSLAGWITDLPEECHHDESFVRHEGSESKLKTFVQFEMIASIQIQIKKILKNDSSDLLMSKGLPN